MGILLSHLGYKVTSIDNDREILASVKENNKKFNGRLNLKYADAFKLPFTKEEFDVTISQGFFEHFSNRDIKKLIDEQLRVSRKAVIISIPNNNYPEKDFGNERLMTKDYWKGLLEYCSGKKVEVQDYQFFLRKNKPFKTIFNLLLGRKVQTLATIYK